MVAVMVVMVGCGMSWWQENNVQGYPTLKIWKERIIEFRVLQNFDRMCNIFCDQTRQSRDF